MPYKNKTEAKNAGFPTEAEGTPMTIEQINKLASIYDALKNEGKVDNPMAVAWTTWKKIYKKVGDKWEKKKASEAFFSFPIYFSNVNIKDKMEIHAIPVGEWDHPIYGKMKIDENDIKEFVKHFKEGIRKGVPITEGHANIGEELPAVGWFKKLINKGSDGLWAIVEWTKQGKELLSQKAYKYFSPEFYRSYEDPETHKVYTNVLTGGALTNMPYFKSLKAIVMSENNILYQFNEKTMNIEEILKKDVADLTDEEKATLKEKSADLTDEQKDKYKDILEDTGDGRDNGENKDDKGDSSDDKDDNKDDDKDDNKDDAGEKDNGVKGSEVKISASEYQELKRNADQGAEAMRRLNENDIKEVATKYEFTEKNQDGKFLPKSKDKVVSFMCSLNKEQSEKFQEILSELPKVQLFGELGDLGSESKTAAKEIEEKVKVKMSEDKAMKYSDALKAVIEENPELNKRYEEENK